MKVTHYQGSLRSLLPNGTLRIIIAGWAACCWGGQAEAVLRAGNTTYDPSRVTCKRCLWLMNLPQHP